MTFEAHFRLIQSQRHLLIPAITKRQCDHVNKWHPSAHGKTQKYLLFFGQITPIINYEKDLSSDCVFILQPGSPCIESVERIQSEAG
jgi:hypothetical protein